MIPTKRCREILGPDCSLSDEELTELARQAHALAEVLIDAYCRGIGLDGEGWMAPSDTAPVN